MALTRISQRRLSRGIALITGLVLLVILSIVALTATRTTRLEYEMSSNSAYQTQARQTSETGRLALSTVLHKHVFDRSWDGITLVSGLSILDKDSNGKADSLITNSVGETFSIGNLLGALVTDARFTDAVSSAPTEVKVYSSATKMSPGSGAAMTAGYMGLGKGAGAGGAAMYFYVLSEGQGHDGARYVTSADVLCPIGH